MRSPGPLPLDLGVYVLSAFRASPLVIIRIIARIASFTPTRGMPVVPLTLLALALVFVVIMATIWPPYDRRTMVDHLAGAIKDLGSVITDADDAKTHGGGRPTQHGRSAGS